MIVVIARLEKEGNEIVRFLSWKGGNQLVDKP